MRIGPNREAPVKPRCFPPDIRSQSDLGAFCSDDSTLTINACKLREYLQKGLQYDKLFDIVRPNGAVFLDNGSLRTRVPGDP